MWSPTDSTSAFGRLLGPGGTEEFFRDYWERQYLHVRRSSSDYYAYALTPRQVDRYLQSDRTSSHFLRVVKDGTYCPAERWTRQGVVDAQGLGELRASGATVVINHGERTFPSLSELCDALEHEIQCHVQANIYVTPAHSQGFAPHADTHGVFVIQIDGRKQWTLYGASVEVIELQPGDLLYIPRGMVHCARTSETASIHATLGPLQPEWSTLVGALARQAKLDPAFGRLLPHGMSSAEEKAAFAKEFTREVSALLERVDLPALMAESIQRNRQERSSRLADQLSLDQVNAASVLRRRPSLSVKVENTDQWIVVQFGSEELSVPAFLRPAMDTLLGEKPFAVRDIAGIPSESGRLALARRFLKAGLLTILRGENVSDNSGRTYARGSNESGSGESQGSVGHAST